MDGPYYIHIIAHSSSAWSRTFWIYPDRHKLWIMGWISFWICILNLNTNRTNVPDSTKEEEYTANVCRGLQGLYRGFLQYLQGKSCNIYRFSLQYLQIAEIAGKICKYYRIFPADIAENPCRVPVNPCKHLECISTRNLYIMILIILALNNIN